ncbi:hypothetical protein JZU48_01615, partial [bacterium]|nr:hypothetical protein [bacterium]
WSKDRDLPTNLGDQIEKEFYPGLRLYARPGGTAPFITDLSGGGGQQPQLIDLIRELVRQRRQAFLNRSGNARIAAEILEWLQNEVMVGQLECTHALRDKWGAVSRQLFSQHTEVLEERVKAALDDMLVSILATPDRGFAFARETLRRVADRLRDQQTELARRADSLRAKGRNRHRDIQVRLGWLDECGGAFTRRTIIDVALDLIEERAADEARAQICEAAGEVSKRLLDHIGSGGKSKDAEGREIVVETGLVKQLSDLQRTRCAVSRRRRSTCRWRMRRTSPRSTSPSGESRSTKES